MSKTVTIELSENQAAHLWGILVSNHESSIRALKEAKVYKKDGTPNLRRKYLSPHQQELDDNIALGKLITDYIESQIDVFQIIRDEDDF